MEIENLLVALDDNRVKEKILVILNSSDDLIISELATNTDNSSHDIERQLSQEINDLRKLLEAKVAHIGQLEDKVNQLGSELKDKSNNLAKQASLNEQLQSQLFDYEKENEDISLKLTFYRDNFTDDVVLHDLYHSLTEQTQNSLSGIFKSQSIKGLVTCGVQEKNIMNLWDYTKNEVVNSTNSEVNKLVKLFTLLFERFILSYPMYSQQSIEVGDEFDNQAYIRHNSSENMSGMIKEILLNGIINDKTNKIVRQAVVKI